MDKKKTENSAENEFKLFNQIEDTIEGTLVFIALFFKTTLFLILHPLRLTQILDSDKKWISFSHPLTYLTVTTVVFSTLTHHVYGFIISLIKFIDTADRSTPCLNPLNGDTTHVNLDISIMAILQGLPDFSADSILKITLPTIIAIIAVSAGLGTLTQRFHSIRRGFFIQVICYITGFQFILSSTLIFALIGFGNLLNPVGIGSLKEIIFDVLNYLSLGLLFSTLILWPSLMLFSIFDKTSIKPFYKKIYKKIIVLTISFMISLIVVITTSVATISPILFKTFQVKPTIKNCSVESMTIDEQYVKTHLSFTNNRISSYLITDKEIMLTILKKQFENAMYGEHILSVALEVFAWSDYERPILEMKKGESKWIIVHGRIDKKKRNTERSIKEQLLI